MSERRTKKEGRARRTHAIGSFIFAVAAIGCGDPGEFIPSAIPGGPRGVLQGTVTYSGPGPCTQNGRVVGAAILLAFDVNLLPPPEGLGTTAASVAVVPGTNLFDGAASEIHFDPSGALFCPDPKAAPVTVSGSWTIAPLPAATYEIRGFYDHDGNFDPTFSISKLPTKGDIGGGAIDNAADVLAGKAPIYRRIPLGKLEADGSLVIPDTGSLVSGIAVTLGLELPLNRPVFYSKAVLDQTSSKNTDPNAVVMPADFQLKTFSQGSPGATETSFIRMDLGAGVAPSEAMTATQSPFNLPPTEPFVFSRQADQVPESALIPSLYPLSLFTRLEDGSLLSGSTPTVILQGITVYKSLLQTALSPKTLNDPLPDVIVALRPAALCIDTTKPTEHGILVTSRKTDSMGNVILTDEKKVEAALAVQFGRPIDIKYGCLPQGKYAVNLVYGTGQAWTVPNEAGVCQPGEAASADGKTCGARARLASQATTLTIGPPTDASYCKANPTPALCGP